MDKRNVEHLDNQLVKSFNPDCNIPESPLSNSGSLVSKKLFRNNLKRSQTSEDKEEIHAENINEKKESDRKEPHFENTYKYDHRKRVERHTDPDVYDNYKVGLDSVKGFLKDDKSFRSLTGRLYIAKAQERQETSCEDDNSRDGMEFVENQRTQKLFRPANESSNNIKSHGSRERSYEVENCEDTKQSVKHETQTKSQKSATKILSNFKSHESQQGSSEKDKFRYEMELLNKEKAAKSPSVEAKKPNQIKEDGNCSSEIDLLKNQIQVKPSRFAVERPNKIMSHERQGRSNEDEIGGNRKETLNYASQFKSHRSAIESKIKSQGREEREYGHDNSVDRKESVKYETQNTSRMPVIDILNKIKPNERKERSSEDDKYRDGMEIDKNQMEVKSSRALTEIPIKLGSHEKPERSYQGTKGENRKEILNNQIPVMLRRSVTERPNRVSSYKREKISTEDDNAEDGRASLNYESESQSHKVIIERPSHERKSEYENDKRRVGTELPKYAKQIKSFRALTEIPNKMESDESHERSYEDGNCQDGMEFPKNQKQSKSSRSLTELPIKMVSNAEQGRSYNDNNNKDIKEILNNQMPIMLTRSVAERTTRVWPPPQGQNRSKGDDNGEDAKAALNYESVLERPNKINSQGRDEMECADDNGQESLKCERQSNIYKSVTEILGKIKSHERQGRAYEGDKYRYEMDILNNENITKSSRSVAEKSNKIKSQRSLEQSKEDDKCRGGVELHSNQMQVTSSRALTEIPTKLATNEKQERSYQDDKGEYKKEILTNQIPVIIRRSVAESPNRVSTYEDDNPEDEKPTLKYESERQSHKMLIVRPKKKDNERKREYEDDKHTNGREVLKNQKQVKSFSALTEIPNKMESNESQERSYEDDNGEDGKAKLNYESVTERPSKIKSHERQEREYKDDKFRHEMELPKKGNATANLSRLVVEKSNRIMSHERQMRSKEDGNAENETETLNYESKFESHRSANLNYESVTERPSKLESQGRQNVEYVHNKSKDREEPIKCENQSNIYKSVTEVLGKIKPYERQERSYEDDKFIYEKEPMNNENILKSSRSVDEKPNKIKSNGSQERPDENDECRGGLELYNNQMQVKSSRALTEIPIKLASNERQQKLYEDESSEDRKDILNNQIQGKLSRSLAESPNKISSHESQKRSYEDNHGEEMKEYMKYPPQSELYRISGREYKINIRESRKKRTAYKDEGEEEAWEQSCKFKQEMCKEKESCQLSVPVSYKDRVGHKNELKNEVCEIEGGKTIENTTKTTSDYPNEIINDDEDVHNKSQKEEKKQKRMNAFPTIKNNVEEEEFQEKHKWKIFDKRNEENEEHITSKIEIEEDAQTLMPSDNECILSPKTSTEIIQKIDQTLQNLTQSITLSSLIGRTNQRNCQERHEVPQEDDNGIDEMTPVKNSTEAKSSRSLTEKPYKTNKRRNNELLQANNDVEREDGTKTERTYKRNRHEIQEIHYQDHKGRYGMNTTKNRTDHKSREEEFEDYHEWVTLDENNEDKPHSYTSLQAEIIEEDAKTVASSINYYNPHEASTGIIDTVHPITSTPKHIKKGDGGEYELKHYYTMKKRIIDIDDNINPEEDDQENIPPIAEDFRKANKFPKQDEGLRNIENIMRKASTTKHDRSLYGRFSANEPSDLYTPSLIRTNKVSKHFTDLDNSNRTITVTKDPEQRHLSNHSTQSHKIEPNTQTIYEEAKQSVGRDISTAKSNYVIHTEEESLSSVRAPQLPGEKGSNCSRNYTSMTKNLNDYRHIKDRPPLNYGIKTCVPYKVWYADKCRTLLECQTCSEGSTAKVLHDNCSYKNTLPTLEEFYNDEQTESHTGNEYATDNIKTECNGSIGCKCGFCRHHYYNWMEAGENKVRLKASKSFNRRSSKRKQTMIDSHKEDGKRTTNICTCCKCVDDSTVINNEVKPEGIKSRTSSSQARKSSSRSLKRKSKKSSTQSVNKKNTNGRQQPLRDEKDDAPSVRSGEGNPSHALEKNNNNKDEKKSDYRLRVKNYPWYVKISWGDGNKEALTKNSSNESGNSNKSNKSAHVVQYHSCGCKEPPVHRKYRNTVVNLKKDFSSEFSPEDEDEEIKEPDDEPVKNTMLAMPSMAVMERPCTTGQSEAQAPPNRDINWLVQTTVPVQYTVMEEENPPIWYNSANTIAGESIGSDTDVRNTRSTDKADESVSLVYCVAPELQEGDNNWKMDCVQMSLGRSMYEKEGTDYYKDLDEALHNLQAECYLTESACDTYLPDNENAYNENMNLYPRIEEEEAAQCQFNYNMPSSVRSYKDQSQPQFQKDITTSQIQYKPETQRSGRDMPSAGPRSYQRKPDFKRANGNFPDTTTEPKERSRSRSKSPRTSTRRKSLKKSNNKRSNSKEYKTRQQGSCKSEETLGSQRQRKPVEGVNKDERNRNMGSIQRKFYDNCSDRKEVEEKQRPQSRSSRKDTPARRQSSIRKGCGCTEPKVRSSTVMKPNQHSLQIDHIPRTQRRHYQELPMEKCGRNGGGRQYQNGYDSNYNDWMKAGQNQQLQSDSSITAMERAFKAYESERQTTTDKDTTDLSRDNSETRLKRYKNNRGQTLTVFPVYEDTETEERDLEPRAFRVEKEKRSRSTDERKFVGEQSSDTYVKPERKKQLKRLKSATSEENLCQSRILIKKSEENDRYSGNMKIEMENEMDENDVYAADFMKVTKNTIIRYKLPYMQH